MTALLFLFEMVIFVKILREVPLFFTAFIIGGITCYFREVKYYNINKEVIRLYYGHVMHLPLVVYNLHRKGSGFVVDYSYGGINGGNVLKQTTLSELYIQFIQRRNCPCSSGPVIVTQDCVSKVKRVYGGRENSKLSKLYEIIDYGPS